ncbi:transposase [Streptomyces sp. NPDC002809]|uniref:transposase n=1 Tax=Streptomyces sp. NPDC002809 TaxID=3154433 RepID=UPI003324CF74
MRSQAEPIASATRLRGSLRPGCREEWSCGWRSVSLAVPEGQRELFTAWRFHAAFTDSTLSLADAEKYHRRHAIVEQVIAELKNGPFAHAPSGNFQANAAWLALAALAFNLMRACGTLADTFHARATCATIGEHLINVPARLARSARRLTLHLPEHWPWQDAFDTLFHVVHVPPPPA